MVKKFIVAVFTVVALMLVPAAASASTSPVANDFGQHVSEMAQQQHFDGTHNPGIHQGKTGWQDHHHAHAG